MKLKAGIMGLGNIGSLFDEDPGRKEVWSHVGAYLASPGVDIVAGAEPDITRLNKFAQRCPQAKPYQDYGEMLKDNRLDIMSICSPTDTHFEILSRTVEAEVKAIFCEKPIASRGEDARQMVDICQAKKVILAVNYTRRWDQNYRRVKEYIDQGKIGEIRSIIGNYSDKVFMMGTHLVDMLRFFGGEVDWVIGEGQNLDADDPGISGLLLFKNGAKGFLTCNGKRENLVFEIDVLGTEGRIRIVENGYRTELFRFEESNRYSGYQELKRQPMPKPKKRKAPLVSAVEDLIECIEKSGEPACTGKDGLKALEIAVALCTSASNNNEKIRIV
ncbi:MAG: hypothetical protein CL875_03050 [Dehalococcoidales bacterium]|nr:hypothetical protein [Dehalococcoidales bacterium]MAF85448.1 hypothetical protein [Dehalococcoidales bacterium]|tara:strand:+ start:623 stop:1612 length:990 start_codon:yes stop_codon:yes gene_type:complete